MKKLLVLVSLALALISLGLMFGCTTTTETTTTSTTATTASTSSTTTTSTTSTTTPTFTFSTETVDNSGDRIGEYSAIAADSSNKVHIAYLDNSSTGLAKIKYASGEAGSWVFTNIDNDTNGAHGHTAIALTSADKVYMSYMGWNSLKHATNNSGSWFAAGVDTTVYSGYNTSIAIGSGSYPHISYSNYTSDYALQYAYLDASGWHITTVDDVVTSLYSSLAIDPSNTVHISYVDTDNGNLKLAHIPSGSGSMSKQTIDSSGTVQNFSTSIKIDGAGYYHIVYYGNQNLKYATNRSGAWVLSTIDSSEVGVGSYNSLAIRNDRLYVSYYDGHNGDLKFATKALSDSSWQTQSIDTTGDIGQYVSVAVDGSGKVHISYYDVTNQALKYAHSL